MFAASQSSWESTMWSCDPSIDGSTFALVELLLDWVVPLLIGYRLIDLLDRPEVRATL